MSIEKFKAYDGNEPYAFISYSHKDSAIVYSVINQLHNDGYRIWYDEGIPLVADYGGVLYEKIEGCEQFVYFVSENSVTSEDVEKEVLNAIGLKKPVLQVVIDDAKLPPSIAYHLPPFRKKLMMNLEPSEFYNKLKIQLSACKNLLPYHQKISEDVKVYQNGIGIGDIVELGEYPQTSDEISLPIEWIVIDVNNDKALLLSRYCIDVVQYHKKDENVNWSTCDLRKWLDGTFCIEAFSRLERNNILKTICKNTGVYSKRFEAEDNGPDTEGKIFLLNINEAEKYKDIILKFSDSFTEYAQSKKDTDDWWLRTSAEDIERLHGHCSAALFNSYGKSSWSFGANVDKWYGLRPALWYKFK